jgi:hypothetical protein
MYFYRYYLHLIVKINMLFVKMKVDRLVNILSFNIMTKLLS